MTPTVVRITWMAFSSGIADEIPRCGIRQTKRWSETRAGRRQTKIPRLRKKLEADK